MENKTYIKGKELKISNEEDKKQSDFHKSRLIFAWIHGKLTFNENENDARSHFEWLTQDFDITACEFEKIPRGYMTSDRIQLFIGSDFRPLSSEELKKITATDLINIKDEFFKVYGDKEVVIYNGVKVGEIGEVWEPIYKLGTFFIS